MIKLVCAMVVAVIGANASAFASVKPSVDGGGTASVWRPAKPAGRDVPPMLTEWGEKVTPENAWREYPRPQMVRSRWTNLNGLWDYAVTEDVPKIPSAWDGKILVPFPLESPLSGVGRLLEPKETLWYRRMFNGNIAKGERLLLNFEQCDFRAHVFVNGVEAGLPHEGGQMPFSYDVTDIVRDGANELVVAVWDPTSAFIGSHGKQTFKTKPYSSLYTRVSGIGGTVWLETVPATYVSGYRVETDIEAGTVTITFKCCQYGNVANASVANGQLEIETGNSGNTGNIHSVSLRPRVKNQFTPDVPCTVKLPAPVALWSPEHPSLYGFTARFGEDEIKGYFGMRKIEKRPDGKGAQRFYLNGEMLFFTATLDQGWWPDGMLTPPSDAAMTFDILTHRKMGFNAMRKHVKVEPRRFYHLCDRLGMIVLQDMPSGFSDPVTRYGLYRRELKELMDHLRNSPSVLMWIPYNESWGQPGEFLTRATVEWMQRYDPTRLVDGPSGWNDYDAGLLSGKRKAPRALRAGESVAGDVVDAHDYTARPRMPPSSGDRARMLSEFGGIGCRVPGHLWTPDAWSWNNTGTLTNRLYVQRRICALLDRVAVLAYDGLAGSGFTQFTDIEGEINGLLTYDRKVEKFDASAIAAANDRIRVAAELGSVPTTSRVVFEKQSKDASAWAWRMDEPEEGWQNANFDDSSWKRSAGGFGDEAVVRDWHVTVSTPWHTPCLYLRRRFSMDTIPENIVSATLEMFHDDDVDVWLNGKKIFSTIGYNTRYERFFIDGKTFSSALRKGDNVLAVKVVQDSGGQYFDAGLTIETLAAKFAACPAQERNRPRSTKRACGWSRSRLPRSAATSTSFHRVLSQSAPKLQNTK